MKYCLPLIITFFFLLRIPANATHIVGGEFQLSYVSGATYRLTLNLYFDKINGSPGALDNAINVSIFEKARNIRMTNLNINLTNRSAVPYTSIACTNASLSTDKIVYTTNIELPENVYNSSNGYYVVWERCCRNNVINNIVNPGAAGQSFYLEFPAVYQNGRRFLNSSPELFPPVSDYACVNELFYYDFGGKDPDGDSLVYEMVTPLNGSSSPASPAPMASPSPYSLVNWSGSANANSQIPGKPSINIHPKTGLLTVRPSQLGLFVFGVMCSEYRNKVKIGEVRRDFQILVLNCPKNDKPKILVKQAGQKNYYRPGDTIKVKANDNRCLDLFLTDTDPDEFLTVEAKPVNFTNTDPLITLTSGTINRNGGRDTLKTSACFPACLTSDKKLYLIDFVVRDDGCSLPKQDTVRVAFQVEPVPNAPPVISTTASSQVFKPKIGDIINFHVTGFDPDKDVVSLSLTGRNFEVGRQSITFPAATGPGTATSLFTWKIDCNALLQASYQLEFTATTTVCNKPVTAKTSIEVQPQYQNNQPTISSPLAGRTIDILFGTSIADTVFATEPDLDLIALAASGDGFDMAEIGMIFKPVTGKGNIKSVFSWQPSCSISEQRQFKVNFAVTESTCKPYPPQVISVIFNVQQESVQKFIPANIFTPNDDGLNDYFTMPALPPDFCNSAFDKIQIYNRWGNMIYQNKDRNFKWDGKNVGDGIYYYHLLYTDKQYKGTVTLVR